MAEFKYIKRISSLNPYTDAMGQYNVDQFGNNRGISGNRQLYTLQKGYNVNEDNINDYSFTWGDGEGNNWGIDVRINYINFASYASDDSGRHTFQVFLLDDAVHYGLKNYVGVTHSEIGNAYLDNAYNGLDTYLTYDRYRC